MGEIQSMLSKEEKMEIGFQTAIRKILENYFGKIGVGELYGYEVSAIAFDVYEIVKLYIEEGGER